jgi:hypothetical protein
MGILESILGSPPDAQPMTIPDRPAAPGREGSSEAAAIFRAISEQRQGRDSLFIPLAPDGATRPAQSSTGVVVPGGTIR